MSDRPARSQRLAKAQHMAMAILEKRNARLDKLRSEIAKRQASGRKTKALDRALSRLPGAEALAAFASAKVRELEGEAAQIAAERETVNRRFGWLDKAAPVVMRRWDGERKDEPKRLNKRKKALVKRTTKDMHPGGEAKAFFGINRQRAKPAETPVAETFPTGPIMPYVPAKPVVQRAGLLSGDYRLVDRPASDPFAARRPDLWTAQYVGTRLADAHAVLRRLPMTTRPKEFGSAMPEYVHVGVELAYQAGAGTLHLGRNRIIGGTSADEVALMHEALAWPMQFLGGEPDIARETNEWAFCSRLFGDPLSYGAARGLKIIADGLNQRKVRVT